MRGSLRHHRGGRIAHLNLVHSADQYRKALPSIEQSGKELRRGATETQAKDDGSVVRLEWRTPGYRLQREAKNRGTGGRRFPTPDKSIFFARYDLIRAPSFSRRKIRIS